MPRAGEVEVYVTRRTAGAAAAWLCNSYIPWLVERYAEPSGLGTGDAELRLEQLGSLAALLVKAASRKRRSTLFSINVDRTLVRAFITSTEVAVACKMLIDRSVLRASMQFRAAARSKRGRHTLRGSALSRRAQSEFIDPRHRKRLTRRDRWERAMEVWANDVFARGESALTATQLPPKF